MKIELEVSKYELNVINASLRLMEQIIESDDPDHDSYKSNRNKIPLKDLVIRINDVMHLFFFEQGFDEPFVEDIDALVHKIIGGDE